MGRLGTRITDATGSDAPSRQGNNEGACSEVTDKETYVEIPVKLGVLVALWMMAILLMAWGSALEGPDHAGDWGLLVSAAAASWTVLYGLGQQNMMLARAFELGYEDGHREVVKLR